MANFPTTAVYTFMLRKPQNTVEEEKRIKVSSLHEVSHWNYLKDKK